MVKCQIHYIIEVLVLFPEKELFEFHSGSTFCLLTKKQMFTIGMRLFLLGRTLIIQKRTSTKIVNQRLEMVLNA